MNDDFLVGDWLVHGGHQYEFFKTHGRFLCTNPDRTRPDFRALGRPKNYSVKYVTEKELLSSDVNVLMVRAGVDYSRMEKHIRRKKISGIAVMQTYLPYEVPSWVTAIVWNSEVVMKRFMKQYPRKKHFYIPHGFDPNEFCHLGLERNGRVLSAAAFFEKRKRVMGFDEWVWVNSKIKKCDLLGHGNEGIKECIGSFPLVPLVKLYNEYSVFFNTTTKSAMPRVRAEALMCGTPVVTTKNYGIERYLIDNKSCLYANSKEDMLISIKKLLSSESMQYDIGQAGREAALKHFHIDKYKERWKEVFRSVLA